MVFQSYAIFPHMNVYDNIAFGLKMNNDAPRPRPSARVRQAAELLHIEEMLDRYPSKMSGGQRQRVAVARAIAMQSQVLLMDEPLSNLDALLRLEMRAELKRLLAEIKATTIYVTHDQIEALSMGDRIAVMRKGEHRAVRQAHDRLRPARHRVCRRLHRQPADELPGGAGAARRTARRRRAHRRLSPDAATV